MESCWLCDRKFQSKTELKVHLISKVHKRQTVICPWCSTEDNTFTRVADLAVHCKTKHLVQTGHMNNFFTLSVCFYFAIHPTDYAKLTTPAEWSSPEALEARRLVMKWVGNVKDPQVKRDNWRAGWRTALKVNNETNESKQSQVTSVGVSKQGKHHNESKKMHKTSTVEKKHVTKVKPENKENMSDKQVDSNQKAKSENSNVLSDVCKVESVKVLQETKVNQNVKPELQVPKEDSDVKTDRLNAQIKDSKTKTKENQEGELEVYKLKANETHENSSKIHVGDEKLDIKADDKVKMIKEQDYEPEDPFSFISQNVTETRCSTPVQDEIKEYDMVSKILNNQNKDANVSKVVNKKNENEHVVKILKRKHEDEQVSYSVQNKDGESVNLVHGNDDVYRRKVLIPKRKVQINENRTDESYIMINKQNETEQAVDNLMKAELDKYKYSPQYCATPLNLDSNTCNFKPVTETSNQTPMSVSNNDYQSRAIEILKSGVMPLCPPARREWGPDTQVTLCLNGNTLLWPPNDWCKMSSDRKLLALEYMAMHLEASTGCGVSANTSRAYLLDKYNYLVLPGTAKHHKEAPEAAASRARFYSHQVLREIATGKDPSEAEIQHLISLEVMKRHSTVPLLDPSSISVPLRLKLEEKSSN